MNLTPRLDDVAARPEHHFLVTGPEPDLALQDDGDLILQGVDVRRYQGTDVKRMLDDGHAATGVLAIDLKHHADPRSQPSGQTFPGPHHLDRERASDRSGLIHCPPPILMYSAVH